MNHRLRFAVPAALIVLFVLPGCGTKRQTGICGDLTAGDRMSGDADSFVAAGDTAWEGRRDVDQIQAAIDNWVKALRVDPSRAGVRVKLSRARYLLADGHLGRNEENEEATLASFDAGVRDAEHALAQLSSGYRDDFCAEKPFVDAIKKADAGSVGAMYWYATNLGKWGLAKGIFTILKYKDNIKAMMDRIVELDGTFFYHAPYRYFGVYYTKIPFPGGDMEKSQENFQKSIDGAPQYLATKVLMAERYCTKVKDRKLFKQLLDEVIAFDLTTAAEIGPENEIEQAKAKDLLEDIDTYFGEEE
jgi:hypothetical protein